MIKLIGVSYYSVCKSEDSTLLGVDGSSVC
jgi:hypothetical protein